MEVSWDSCCSDTQQTVPAYKYCKQLWPLFHRTPVFLLKDPERPTQPKDPERPTHTQKDPPTYLLTTNLVVLVYLIWLAYPVLFTLVGLVYFLFYDNISLFK